MGGNSRMKLTILDMNVDNKRVFCTRRFQCAYEGWCYH